MKIAKIWGSDKWSRKCILSTETNTDCEESGKGPIWFMFGWIGLENVRHGFYLCAEVGPTIPPRPSLAPSWKCFPPREVSRQRPLRFWFPTIAFFKLFSNWLTHYRCKTEAIVVQKAKVSHRERLDKIYISLWPHFRFNTVWPGTTGWLSDYFNSSFIPWMLSCAWLALLSKLEFSLLYILYFFIC